MLRSLKNISILSKKEMVSLFRDKLLISIVLFAFSIGTYLGGIGQIFGVENVSVAIVDSDRSELSLKLKDSLQGPMFKTPDIINKKQADIAFAKSKYLFIIEIPSNFEANILANRKPEIQILADATAMPQSVVGTQYIQQIFISETLNFQRTLNIENVTPVNFHILTYFNPNGYASWHGAEMELITDLTILSIILVGAAVIREKERGTIEHLMVMPVTASEIFLSKILANGFFILIITLFSLWFVVHKWIGAEINGSITLFACATVIYLFSSTSLGIFLATLAPTMPQFSLLCIPVYAVVYLLSGAATPVESMPEQLHYITKLLPMTQYVSVTQAILSLNAGIDSIWRGFLLMIIFGLVFLALALYKFKSMLVKQL